MLRCHQMGPESEMTTFLCGTRWEKNSDTVARRPPKGMMLKGHRQGPPGNPKATDTSCNESLFYISGHHLILCIGHVLAKLSPELREVSNALTHQTTEENCTAGRADALQFKAQVGERTHADSTCARACFRYTTAAQPVCFARLSQRKPGAISGPIL